MIAAIAAGVGSAAAAVLLIAVVILITIALLKIKYTGKHVMGCVYTIKQKPLSSSEHQGNNTINWENFSVKIFSWSN